MKYSRKPKRTLTETQSSKGSFSPINNDSNNLLSYTLTHTCHFPKNALFKTTSTAKNTNKVISILTILVKITIGYCSISIEPTRSISAVARAKLRRKAVMKWEVHLMNVIYSPSFNNGWCEVLMRNIVQKPYIYGQYWKGTDMPLFISLHYPKVSIS